MTSNRGTLFTSLYSIFIAVLALVSVIFLTLELFGKISLAEQPFQAIDTGILLIFAVDYAVRFFRAEDKKAFFKKNIPDLLAIIPFSSLFSAFRLFRMFRILKASRFLKLARFVRMGAFVSVIWRRFGNILKTNGFIYVLYANLFQILCSSVVMMYVENMTFPDALWWSFVTCTTVGYGDIAPSSMIGRIIAVLLMLFGIGMLGMLTGAITTYFTTQHEKEEQTSMDELQNIIENASDEERQKILEIAKIVTGRKD